MLSNIKPIGIPAGVYLNTTSDHLFFIYRVYRVYRVFLMFGTRKVIPVTRRYIMIFKVQI